MSHRCRNARAALPLLLGLLAGGGCSTFNETHYFKDNADPRNYYRLRITGGTALASSRYVSGYFDESAIDTYFGEFTQPEKGRFLPRPPAASDGAGTGTGTGTDGGEGEGGAGGGTSDIQPLTGDANLDDRKLLLLLTTNSDEIATGIQSLAQNEAIATTLAGILNRGRITGARDAASELTAAKARAKMIADEGTRLITGLADDAPQADVKKNLLAYANTLARYLGGPGGFADLNAAADWLSANRARLEARLLEE